MHRHLPKILRCIRCNEAELKLADDAKTKLAYQQIESIESGKLVCSQCHTTYTIQQGILNFLPKLTPNIGLGQWTNQNKLTAWGYERFWRPKALTILGGRAWPPREELDTIIGMLQSPEPNRLNTYDNLNFYLDQACSTGFYARAIVQALDDQRLNKASSQGHVVAIDNSWSMLLEARKFAEKAGMTGRISFVRADAEQMPFRDQAFAGIANGGSLNEFQNPSQALHEVRRTLDPYGKAAFMVQMHSAKPVGSAINDFIHKTSGIHFFRLDALNELYAQADLKLQEQQVEGLITISSLS